jgi:thiol-disulfide isomerase/thioredoxin
MKNKILVLFVILSVLMFRQHGFAADTNSVIPDLKLLVAKVNAKLQQGKHTENDFADELKEFDALYAKYKDLKTEEVAQIPAMKAELYLEVIYDPEKAAEAFQQIKRDMPETATGKRVDTILDSLKKPIEAEQIRNTLAEGTQFPDFDEKDLTGKPLSLASYKGKVVLIDFWATWCPPCVRELPNTLKVYQKYHDQGFDVMGVSLDDDQPQLEKFLKANSMTWPQFFDGQGVKNKLALKYGIEAIPATFLLDGDGKIIGKDLRGDELEAAVSKALKKN